MISPTSGFGMHRDEPYDDAHAKIKRAARLAGAGLLICIAAFPFAEFHISWQEADIESRDQYGIGIMEWAVLPNGDEYEIDTTEALTSFLAMGLAVAIYINLGQR